MSKTGIFAGALGAVTMSMIMALARAIGAPINLEMLLGTMVTRTIGSAAWLLGFTMHVAVGAMFGAVYAWLLSWLRVRIGAVSGMWIGLIHAAIVGVALLLLPAIHPLMPELYPAPGPLFLYQGLTAVIVFIGVHLIYGAIVGAMVARARR